MQKIILTFLLLAIVVNTFAAKIQQSDDEGNNKEGIESEGEDRGARGFGCPFSRYECHNHCKGIPGRNGGYCGGNWLGTTCICYV